MDESYKDDIICRDAALATDPPGQILAGLLFQTLADLSLRKDA
jgi:hypothetical protein